MAKVVGLLLVLALPVACVVSAVCANTPAPGAPPTASPPASTPVPVIPPAAVLEHEKAGRLDQALAELRRAAAPADAPHAAQLEAAMRAMAVSAVYRQHQQWDAARESLDAVRTKLDPVRDIYVRLAIDEALAAVLKDRQQAGDAAAQALLDRSRAFVAEKLYDPAIAAAKHVAERKPEDVSPTVIQAARAQAFEAEGAKARAQTPEFWRAVGESTAKALQTIMQAVILLAVAGLAIVALVFAPGLRRVRDETALVVEDASAGPTEREQRRRQLTREVAWALGSGRGASATRIDERDDLDTSAFVNLRFTGEELAGIDSLVQDAGAITIGPVSFNPRQLLAYLARHRTHYTLSGALSTQGNTTVLTMLRLDASGQPIPGETWEAQATGEGARAQVIREVSRQVLFNLTSDPAKPDWRSFRDHRRALDVLADDSPMSREQRLETALRYLQSSVRYDPSHWRARFDLATVLRKLGRNELAADHFRFIDDSITRRSGTRPGQLDAFLTRHPDFELVVRYNLAVALSKLGPRALNDARKLLDGVATALAGDAAGIEPPAKARLDILTSSARAALLADEIEDLAETSITDWSKGAQNEKVDEIVAMMDDLATRQVDQVGGDWNAMTSALAISYNALGRAQTVVGRFDKAYEGLRKALAQMPDFADPYLNLAELERRRKATQEWPRIVEEHLTHALELNPSSQRAHFLLGRLLASAPVGRPEEAKKHLALAPSFPWASYEMAQLLADEGDLDGAIRELRRSVSIDHTADHRLDTFVRYALRSARQHPNPRLLAEARQIALRLQQSARSESDRKKAAPLLEQIDTLRATTQAGPDAEAPTPDNTTWRWWSSLKG